MAMTTTKKRKLETISIEEAKMIHAKVAAESVMLSKRKRVLEKPKKIFSKKSMSHSTKIDAQVMKVAAESLLLSKRTRVLEKPKKAANFSKKSVSHSTKLEAQVTINGTKRAIENPKARVLPTIGVRVDEKKNLEKMKSKSTTEIITEWRKLTQERERQRQREAARIEIEKIEREHEKKASVGETEFQNLETMQQLEMLCGFSVSCQCQCLHYKGYTSVMDMGASEVVGHGIPLKNLLGFFLKNE